METLKEGRWQSRKGGGLQLCVTLESVLIDRKLVISHIPVPAMADD